MARKDLGRLYSLPSGQPWGTLQLGSKGQGSVINCWKCGRHSTTHTAPGQRQADILGPKPLRKSAIVVANCKENSVDTCDKGYRLYKISQKRSLHSQNKSNNNNHNNELWRGG